MITKIIKFSADWCGPCKLLKEELSDFDILPIEEVDVDENEELCVKYSIRNVPTLIFIDDKDNVVGRHAGYINKDSLKEKIDKLN